MDHTCSMSYMPSEPIGVWLSEVWCVEKCLSTKDHRHRAVKEWRGVIMNLEKSLDHMGVASRTAMSNMPRDEAGKKRKIWPQFWNPLIDLRFQSVRHDLANIMAGLVHMFRLQSPRGAHGSR